jgi:predicted RNA binding protein YcfA (HicA-like mRNA interferase family)
MDGTEVDVPRWFKRRQQIPRTMNQREAQALLESNGWKRTLGGKHVVKMEKEGRRPITLPSCNGEQYSVGLTSRILTQAGLK